MVSSPVPASVAVSVALPVEELGTVRVPVNVPGAVGLKVTLMVQAPAAAIDALTQVLAVMT